MRDVIIIGSGPAGLTASIYTARANLKPLVLEGLQPGGQLTITTEVENFPGFEHGIMGPDLMDVMRKQSERFGAEHVFALADKVDLTARPFKVWYEDKVEEAKAIIIATGASARTLQLPKEDRLMGRGVSACATCDGFFFAGKEVAVIGGGDSAMEEATFLTKFATKVTVIHRREELRASKIMQERALRNPKIAFIWNSTVDELVEGEDGTLSAVRVRNLKNGEVNDLRVDGLFYAIGHTPNTAFLEGQLQTDANGYLVLTGETGTNVEGVFAAGDVADHRYRQAITAAGMGCKAALDTEKFLVEHEG
jgi:thioredoxin reductase (NADPH)